MNFFVGGYYLVQGAERTEWMDKDLLPPMLWTASSCICSIYPDTWVFTWTTDKHSQQRRKSARKLLRINNSDFALMQAQFDKLLENDEFGYPNVFLNVELAKGFYKQYLKHVPDVKLLSIALPELYWTEFIDEFTPHNIAENGVRKKLRQQEILESDISFRGFEVLGYEWGNFHSFVCNSLEKDYYTKLAIALNSNGLIDDYGEAVRAANYTRRDDVGAEPVVWQPWLISEYQLGYT